MYESFMYGVCGKKGGGISVGSVENIILWKLNVRGWISEKWGGTSDKLVGIKWRIEEFEVAGDGLGGVIENGKSQ